MSLTLYFRTIAGRRRAVMNAAEQERYDQAYAVLARVARARTAPMSDTLVTTARRVLLREMDSAALRHLAILARRRQQAREPLWADAVVAERIAAVDAERSLVRRRPNRRAGHWRYE
jgi:hypothetical protein